MRMSLAVLGCVALFLGSARALAQTAPPLGGATSAGGGAGAEAKVVPGVALDVAHAGAPLFDDPVFHGASDPFVIWNPVKKAWYMYYTQRRANVANPRGVDWVHGSAIGIATSEDGKTWKYLGVCQGDHDLSEPLKATNGKGPVPGITWWAPCFLWEGGKLHMWVVLVDGVYTSWTGNRNIVHFTSDDGVNWKYADTCKLSSNRVIDATVYKVKEAWYMVYKDEADGSHTRVSSSKDLQEWTTLPERADADGGQEAPFAFQWKGAWWLIVDAGNQALRVYKSESGYDKFVYNNTVLAGTSGTRTKDNNLGKHPGIVLQGGANNDEQCVIFYFTHQGNQTVIQVAELEVGADGKMVCDRNKYAKAASVPATGPATMPR